MESTNKLIMAFVTLIIGVVLLNVMAGQTLVVTDSTKPTTAITGPSIVRWGPDNNVNTTFRWYLNDSGVTSATYSNTNPVVGCGGYDTANMYIYNGTATTPGTSLGASGAGNWTLTCSTTTGQAYITFANSSGLVANIGNTSAIYLAYYPYSYLETGWNRTILNMIPGFFALGLLGVSLALFYSVAKDYGIA